MRKSHTKVITKVDPLLPVDLVAIKSLMKEEDCFGKEWNPQTSECSICASAEICGMITNDSNKKKKAKQGPYLDEVSTKVNWDKVKAIVIKYEERGEPMPTIKLYHAIEKQTKSRDRKLIIAMIKKFIASDDKLYTKDKQIRYRLC